MSIKDRIVRSTDSLAITNATVVVYGEPGVGKTTLAQTASRPFTMLFDAEGALRAGLREDLLQIVALTQTANRIREANPDAKVISWPELRRDLDYATDFKDYDTIIIDTAGEMVEAIKAFAVADNIKNKGSFSGLSGPGWGVVAEAYRWLTNQAYAAVCDVVVIGQLKEESGRGDKSVERLDMPGAGRQIVMSQATQMGWYGAIGDRRMLRFKPEEGRYTKDSVGLGNIFVPIIDSENNGDFLARSIAVIKGRINKRNEGTAPSTPPSTSDDASNAPAKRNSAPTEQQESISPSSTAAPPSPRNVAGDASGAAESSSAAPATSEPAPEPEDDDPFGDPDAPGDIINDAALAAMTVAAHNMIRDKVSKADRQQFVADLKTMGLYYNRITKKVERRPDAEAAS